MKKTCIAIKNTIFKNINKDIFLNLFDYISIKDIYNLYIIIYNPIIIEYIRERVIFNRLINNRKYKLTYDLNHTCNNCYLNMILSTFPVLPFKDHYLGETDYLDNIKMYDLTYPIMVGVDYYKRPYITVKYRCLDTYCEFNGEKLAIKLSA